jgi:hypothetical protein
MALQKLKGLCGDSLASHWPTPSLSAGGVAALPLRASPVPFVCGQHYRTHQRSFMADSDMDRTLDILLYLA